MIPNLGEKKFVAASEEGVTRRLTSQVAGVSGGLLAVRGMVSTGHRVVFDSDGHYIEDKETGESMAIEDDGKMYNLDLWCRKESF